MQSYINEEKMKKTINKSEIYSQNSTSVFDKINDLIDSFIVDYKSKNSAKINDINIDFKNKFTVLKNNNQNNIYVLKKNLSNYSETKEKVESSFNNLAN